MYKVKTKIVASILVFLMMFTYVSILGEVVAASLEDQTLQTNHANVEFDVYFKQDKKKTHSTTQTIEGENYLYATLAVKQAGYLKNASITLEEGANFQILEAMQSDTVNKVEKNKITLNQIKNGNTVELSIPIQMVPSTNIKVEDFDKQSTILFTATYIDGNGREKKIEKEVTVQLAWTAEKQAELNMQIAKFIPYNLNGQKGLMLQTIVQSQLKDNTLPVKENKIEISVPTINNEKPQNVKVVANTTKATNGDITGIHFNEENYFYHAKSGLLTIQTSNQETEEGTISWNKQAQDEFVVTYLYPETAILEEVNLSIQANSELTLWQEEAKVQQTLEGQITLTEPISSLVDFTVETTAELSKGQIYANELASQKIETEYETTMTANVGLAEVTDKVILQQQADNFVTQENAKVAAETYDKTISLSKENFDKVLGEEGYIHIFVGETKIAEINSETEANEQGNLQMDLTPFNTNSIRIETSKPMTEGKLVFTIRKAIKGEISYTASQMQQVNQLEQTIRIVAISGQESFAEQTITKAITLKEPTMQAEIAISNANLSTVITNQNVKLTAILKTDSLDCSLYQNPTLQIVLPKYIENMDIKNIEVLFETEGAKLTLKDSQLIQNQDGTKTIFLQLEGIQTEYTLGAMSKGVNVVITADITVNQLTPNKQEQIVMTYANHIATTRSSKTQSMTSQVSTEINFVAPTGVVTTNAISNYAENAQEVTSISGEEKVATIETMAEARNATFAMNVINNYNNTIDHISILGKLPTKENLNSTIDMPLLQAIQVSGVDKDKVEVYYSENANATKDLNAEANNWTSVPESFENVKSYLIDLKDYAMNTADAINFSYTAQIPENLQHNASAYENYEVYFNNNLETGILQDKQVATKVGVTTGKGPELEASIASNVEETQVVATGKFIKYTVSVTNIGEEVADNVVATVALPSVLNKIEFFEGEQGQYTQDYEATQIALEIGSMEPNQTITKSFWAVVEAHLTVEDICKEESHYIKEEIATGNTDEQDSSKEETITYRYHNPEIVHKDSDYKTIVTTKASVTATDLAKPVESNEVKNTVKNAMFRISVGTTTNGLDILNEGDMFTYSVAVGKGSTNKTITNTVVTTTIPEELDYQKAEIEYYDEETDTMKTTTEGISYNSETRVVTILLDELQEIETRQILITSKVKKLPDGQYSKAILSQVEVVADGIEAETSNPIIDTIAREGVTVVQTANVPANSTLSAGGKLTYKLTITNVGGNTARNIKVVDNLPKDLQYVSTDYTIGEETNTIMNIDDNNKTELIINIPKGEKAEISIHTVVKEVTEPVTISNIIEASSDTLGTINSNSISHTIDAVDYENKENPETILRRISGNVWQDENHNGKKEENEPKVAGVEVVLFNNATGAFVKNEAGNILKEVTDQNGNYTFKGIKVGNYTVIFLYDVINYSATSYQVAEASDETNSDAIDSQITLNGENRIAGITEEIKVSDSNIYNIDLGLVVNPKFDLKLDKTVSSITVQDSTGTNKYDCKDTKLAKRDLVGKQINNTTILVEYKITVTNEGAISGFVKKIADYMPSEMKFNSELNKDWYTSGDGVLFNASLANTMINPGESKEVTLLLTKKMTNENVGLYNNTAEIYEAYNDLGIADMDSTVANKQSNEDDLSSADVLITVKTGETILVAGLSITIIVTIGIGAYIIKKKVLR